MLYPKRFPLADELYPEPKPFKPMTLEEAGIQVAPASASRGEFSKGAEAFGNQLQAMGGGLLEMGATAVKQVAPEFVAPALDSAAQTGREIYQRNIEEAAAPQLAPKVPKIEDIKPLESGGLTRAFDWAAYNMPQVLGTTAVALGAGGVGGAAARALMPGAVGAVRAGSALAKAGLPATAEQVAAGTALRAATLRGAQVGAGAAMFGMEGGSEFGDLRQSGVSAEDALAPSLAVGAVNAALEYLPFGIAARYLGLTGKQVNKGIREVIKNDAKLATLAKNLAKAAAAGVGAEGVTEGMQELVSIAGERWAQQEAIFDKLTPEQKSRVANAAAVGAVGGAVLGGGVGGIKALQQQQVAKRLDERLTKKDEAEAEAKKKAAEEEAPAAIGGIPPVGDAEPRVAPTVGGIPEQQPVDLTPDLTGAPSVAAGFEPNAETGTVLPTPQEVAAAQEQRGETAPVVSIKPENFVPTHLDVDKKPVMQLDDGTFIDEAGNEVVSEVTAIGETQDGMRMQGQEVGGTETPAGAVSEAAGEEEAGRTTAAETEKPVASTRGWSISSVTQSENGDYTAQVVDEQGNAYNTWTANSLEDLSAKIGEELSPPSIEELQDALQNQETSPPDGNVQPAGQAPEVVPAAQGGPGVSPEGQEALAEAALDPADAKVIDDLVWDKEEAALLKSAMAEVRSNLPEGATISAYKDKYSYPRFRIEDARYGEMGVPLTVGEGTWPEHALKAAETRWEELKYNPIKLKQRIASTTIRRKDGGYFTLPGAKRKLSQLTGQYRREGKDPSGLKIQAVGTGDRYEIVNVETKLTELTNNPKYIKPAKGTMQEKLRNLFDKLIKLVNDVENAGWEFDTLLGRIVGDRNQGYGQSYKVRTGQEEAWTDEKVAEYLNNLREEIMKSPDQPAKVSWKDMFQDIPTYGVEPDPKFAEFWDKVEKGINARSKLQDLELAANVYAVNKGLDRTELLADLKVRFLQKLRDIRSNNYWDLTADDRERLDNTIEELLPYRLREADFLAAARKDLLKQEEVKAESYTPEDFQAAPMQQPAPVAEPAPTPAPTPEPTQPPQTMVGEQSVLDAMADLGSFGLSDQAIKMLGLDPNITKLKAGSRHETPVKAEGGSMPAYVIKQLAKKGFVYNTPEEFAAAVNAAVKEKMAGAQQSVSPDVESISLDTFKQAVRDYPGLGSKFLDKLEKSGLIVYHEGAHENGQTSGEWRPDEQRFHIWLGSMPKDSNPVGVLLHEGSHGGMKAILASRFDEYAKVITDMADKGSEDATSAQLSAVVNLARTFAPIYDARITTLREQLDSATDEAAARELEKKYRDAVLEARKQILDTPLGRDTFNEEVIAYYIQLVAQKGTSTGVFRRILDAIKAWWIGTSWGEALAAAGLQPKLTDGMALALAKQSMRVAQQVKQYTEGLGVEASDQAALETFAGPQAKTADVRKLAAAERFTNMGYDPDQVWGAAGWMRGADNAWRFEIDDSKASFRTAFEALEEDRQFSLGNFLKHDELFAAYPDLKSIRVVKEQRPANNPAMYSPANQLIHLSSSLSSEETLKNLLHEVQHIIQYKEDWAQGGGVMTVRFDDEKSMEKVENFLREKLADPASKQDKLAPHMVMALVELEEIRKTQDKLRAAYGDYDYLNALLKDLATKFNNGTRVVDIGNQKNIPIQVAAQSSLTAFQQVSAKLKSLHEGTNIDYFAYSLLAGEQEAELTANRKALTAAERKAQFPGAAFDAPAKYHIVAKEGKVLKDVLDGVNKLLAPQQAISLESRAIDQPISLSGSKAWLFKNSDARGVFEEAVRGKTRVIDAFGGSGVMSGMAMRLFDMPERLVNEGFNSALGRFQEAMSKDRQALTQQILDVYDEVKRLPPPRVAQRLVKMIQEGSAGAYYLGQNVSYNNGMVYVDDPKSVNTAVGLIRRGLEGGKKLENAIKALNKVGDVSPFAYQWGDGWALAATAGANDVVLLDPPYIPGPNVQSRFLKMGENITLEDTIGYLEALKPAMDRGASFVFTNKPLKGLIEYLRSTGWQTKIVGKPKVDGKVEDELVAWKVDQAVSDFQSGTFAEMYPALASKMPQQWDQLDDFQKGQVRAASKISNSKSALGRVSDYLKEAQQGANTAGAVKQALESRGLESRPPLLDSKFWWTDPMSSEVDELNEPGLLQRLQANFIDFFASIEKKAKDVYDVYDLARSIKSARILDYRKIYADKIRNMIVNNGWDVDRVGDWMAARHILADGVNHKLAVDNSNAFSIEFEKLLHTVADTLHIPSDKAQMNKIANKLTKARQKKRNESIPADQIREDTFKLFDDVTQLPFITNPFNDPQKRIAEFLAEWNNFKLRAAGMSDSEAQALKVEYEQHGAKFDDFADLFDALNQETLKVLVDGDIITQSEADRMQSKWQHYAPLRRDAYDIDNDTLLYGFGPGRQVKTRAGMRSQYRDAPVHVLENSLARLEAAVAAAEKNRANNYFWDTIQNNYSEWENWFTKASDTEEYAVRDDKGFVIKKSGTIQEPNAIFFIKGGKRLAFFPKAENQRAVWIAQAINNLGAKPIEGPLKVLNWINSLIRWVNISASPYFLMTNAPRDAFTALYNLQAYEETKGQGQKILGQYKNSFRALRRVFMGDLKDVQASTDPDFEWVKRYEAAGGRISFVQSFKEMDTTFGSWERQVRRRQGKLPQWTGATGQWKWGGKKAGQIKDILDRIEDINIVVENVMRFSTFKLVAQQQEAAGKTRKEADRIAARIAKDITTNFTRKGFKSQTMGLLYLFLNATIQGNYQVVRNILQSKRLGKLVAGTVMFSALVDIAARAMSDDDDKDGRSNWDSKPEWDAERNIHLPFQIGGVYPKIPAPWVFNIFWRGGQMLGETISGDRKLTELGADLVGMMLTTFNPLGSDPIDTPMQFLTPTALDPFVQIASNTNAFGNPLSPENFPGDTRPDAMTYWSNIPEEYKDVAQWINEITGGNVAESGAVDLRPSTLKVLADTLTGGLGRAIVQTMGFTGAALEGELSKLETRDIPVLRQFSTSATADPMETQLYHERISKVMGADKALRLYRSGPNMDRDAANRIARERRPDLSLVNYAKDVEKQIKSLRQKSRMAESRGQDALAERLQKRIDMLRQRFNTTYARRVGH